MADEKRPKVIIPAIKGKAKPKQGTQFRPRPRRHSREQLELIADQVASDARVMDHLRRGYDSAELSRNAIAEVTNRAQEIDPSISASEGIRIFSILAIRLNKSERGQ